MIEPIDPIHSDRMKSLIEYTSFSVATQYPSPFGATVNEDASEYWEQPLDIPASEIANRMPGNKCTLVPEVERALAQQLFKDWKAAIDDTCQH